MIAAYGANTSFEVTWNPAGIDSSSTESYVGVYASGTWTLSHITSGTGKDGKFQGVFRSPCASFTDDGACSRLYDSLCITCGGSPVADSCKP